MKIAVTGAAGRLGTRTCRALLDGGHEVVAIDKVSKGPLPYDLHTVTLLDSSKVIQLLEGCEAVVHSGNYASAYSCPMPNLFNENVAMNMNVFHAAKVTGIRKVVFTSSIQVIASEEDPGEEEPEPEIAYLPLDGESPANPKNGYALSKLVGEMMLRNYAERLGWQAVALRLPTLFLKDDEEGPKPRGWLNPNWHVRASIGQGFAILSHWDAARLIRAFLESELKGFRVYLPAHPLPRVDRPVKELLQEYYDKVALRRLPEELTSLVDISHICKETGWRPQDPPPYHLPEEVS